MTELDVSKFHAGTFYDYKAMRGGKEPMFKKIQRQHVNSD